MRLTWSSTRWELILKPTGWYKKIWIEDLNKRTWIWNLTSTASLPSKQSWWSSRHTSTKALIRSRASFQRISTTCYWSFLPSKRRSKMSQTRWPSSLKKWARLSETWIWSKHTLRSNRTSLVTSSRSEKSSAMTWMHSFIEWTMKAARRPYIQLDSRYWKQPSGNWLTKTSLSNMKSILWATTRINIYLSGSSINSPTWCIECCTSCTTSVSSIPNMNMLRAKHSRNCISCCL